MKNVLIIGGSSDIGLSIANYFKKLQYNVLVGYNTHPLKDNIPSKKCDITNSKSIEDIIKYAINLYGNIDILINLASISKDNDFLSLSKEDFMSILEVNLVGTFLCNQIYSKYINNGLIINMSSTDGIDTYSEYSLGYSTSKSALITMSKIIANCTSNKVICLCPNWIDSDTTNAIDKEYLHNELLRINQTRLITKEELIIALDKILNMNTTSGSIYRIDIKEDKLWLEKM